MSSPARAHSIPRNSDTILCLEQGRYRESRTWATLSKPEVPQNLFYKKKDSLLRAFPPLLNAQRHTQKNHLNDKKLFARIGYKITVISKALLFL